MLHASCCITTLKGKQVETLSLDLLYLLHKHSRVFDTKSERDSRQFVSKEPDCDLSG